MTTLTKVLLAIIIVTFSAAAIDDYTRHDTHSMLRALFLGAMICFVVLRANRLPRRTKTPPA